MKHLAVMLLGLLAFAGSGASQTAWTTPTTAEVDAVYPDIESLYIDLHQNPELAFQEVQTAAKLVARVKALGYEVTTGVGRTGIVAVMKNGPGPTVMLRTELDALPLEEKPVFRLPAGLS
jgi:metal-dependent amidase/aminoacylase/carboxypeptidase family protein